MAVRDFVNHTRCANFANEIEVFRESSSQLLSIKKLQSSNTRDARTSQTLYNGSNSETSHRENTQTSVSPLLSHYRYKCSYRHCDDPINSQGTSLPHLPPIGVFWDIENCQVPKGRSAIAVCQVIRDKFYTGYKEAEFIVVCDVQKENHQIMQELNDAQVNLIHVAATCKNAADEKLKQSIRRFADIHSSPSAIILISGDINFAADLSDLRHRKKIHVILLHNKNTSEALILCANEHYDFMDLMESLPYRTPGKILACYDLTIINLPEDKDVTMIKRRLKQLSDNCGGRVIDVQSSNAIVRFGSQNSAERAQKRMDGELVLGSRISVKFCKEKYTPSQKFSGGIAYRDRASSESEVILDSPKQMYNTNSSVSTAPRAILGSHFQSPSVVGSYPKWGGMHCAPVNPPLGMIPAPFFIGRPFSATSDMAINRSYNEIARSQSPLVWQLTGGQQYNRVWEEQYKVEKVKFLGKRSCVPQVRDHNGNNEVPRTMRNNHASFNHTDYVGSRQSLRPVVSTGPNENAKYQTNSHKRRSPSPTYVTQTINSHHRNNQIQNALVLRNRRTPSPYNEKLQNGQECSYHSSDVENEEIEKFFYPIKECNENGTTDNNGYPIELQVTNLDQNIDPKEMKRILSCFFTEYVTVLHIAIFTQSDGNFAASIKVPSLSDAQYAISQLHRRRIGYKRILISYAHTGGSNPQLIRAQIVMLLQEVPGHRLPLFKFREMYENRFMISVSVSELYKMKDVCTITEDPGCRMISLNPDHRNTPSPCGNDISQDEHYEFPFCIAHTPKLLSNKGWAEQELVSLPNVKISLNKLSTVVRQLLTSHNGTLPLHSLLYCYEAEFHESLNLDENGAPLEHLISCLTNVELKQNVGSVKNIVWKHPKNSEENDCQKCVSPLLVDQLALLSREIVDLLKTIPHCLLSFNKFIPAYHHHFGRQCRVADYGFTKLIDLLEAIPHIAQVMGEGNKRAVTLSHRAQIRRFTSDLLRILKSTANKLITLSEFPNVYAKVIGKAWDIVDYGVCELDDILNEISENTVVMVRTEGEIIFSIPKREQTPEEMERTRQFAKEAIEILRHVSQCRMMFNKFVPSYHHHFGHQCRVSDYGFTKLIELFEAIPDVIKIEDVDGGERLISLTEKYSLCVLGEQISKLITQGILSVSNIEFNFIQQYGYALRPEFYACDSILQLMQKLDDNIKIINHPTGLAIVPVDKSQLQNFALQCRRVLMDQPNRRLSMKGFQQLYYQYYTKNCNIDELTTKLSNVFNFFTENGEGMIELTPLYSFACDVHNVMIRYGGTLNLSQFENAFLTVTGTACMPAQYGFSTLLALLQAIPCTIIIKDGRNKKKILHLNRQLTNVGFPLPLVHSSTTTSHQDTDSNNESLESDSSINVNVSKNSTNSEDSQNWPLERTIKIPPSWTQTKEKESNNPWTTSNGSNGWSELQSKSEILLANLIRRPSSKLECLPPPKPDSPPHQSPLEMSKTWNPSIWSSEFPGIINSEVTQVELPQLVPYFDDTSIQNEIKNLLSPIKSLLTATANPLCPSSFFSKEGNLVVAPHPSELPLPLMTLSSKNFIDTNNDDSKENDENINEITNSSPGKSAIGSKRRLAAQFN